ncbi:MAG: hypothetical protein A2275_03750 [Bacteroidetes bacterium RIFOXYA12_FULL_35_11]|nr:MAG: hypothetical protein A2X01_02690 [Bacteroidetes bacterium GWF2_35_48]OFY73407.1 MAG: hypothetical protein A2275_03750 [Bacteroidetes bacterium RIFOXYA12_FULL_35_11]OFY93465.1 MAG: hypothetical protein A2309_11860 [Bacteroidetes bacterium RIFOXYB2_FULL_35_7]OFY96341.1 MAG: hypothetical protein A2491_06355 [Bacteroidetes bacterium RIFOXYC12_FULL_35_7]HBX51299.1 hypothetical protein [Bacteroidales bacterium]
MKYSILITVIFIINSVCGFSQNTPPSNDLDNLYTPPAGSVLDTKGAKSTSQTKPGSVTQSKNITLFNLALVLRSNIYVTYERSLNDQFSVLGGLGTYFARDMFEFVTSEMGSELFSSSDDGGTHYRRIWNPLYSDLSSGGIQFGFAGRFYFEDDYEDRSYLELGARYYQWYFTSKTRTGSSVILKPGTEFAIYNQQYFLNYGKQYTTGDKIKFAHEFYYGIGLRFYSCDELEDTETTNVNGSSLTTYSPTGNRHSLKTISLLLGYKLGIGW